MKRNLEVKELTDIISKSGYLFGSKWKSFSGSKEVKRTTYVKYTQSVDLPVPLDLVEKALSEIGPYSLLRGSYSVDITETLDGSGFKEESFSFGYLYLLLSRGANLPVEVRISISGKLSAPFPLGEVESCDLEADLYIGPVPMGRGQAKRSEEMIRSTIFSIPSFLEVFPNADVFAVWETRGGWGGIKPKFAHRYVGRVKDVVALYQA